MNWISVKERLPDAIRCAVVVYSPLGLYEEDFQLPSYHVLYWYKTGFSEQSDRSLEIISKITHWIILPEIEME